MSPIIHTRPATPQDYPALAAIARESQELHREAHPSIFMADTPGFTEEQMCRQNEQKGKQREGVSLARQLHASRGRLRQKATGNCNRDC